MGKVIAEGGVTNRVLRAFYAVLLPTKKTSFEDSNEVWVQYKLDYVAYRIMALKGENRTGVRDG